MKNYQEQLHLLFEEPILIQDNFISFKESDANIESNQQQTKDIFSDKWESTDKIENVEKLYDTQYKWFLSLYGFQSENDLKEYLKDKHTIIDTGCGLGYKAQWFATLAPHALVIGIDISDSCKIAARIFSQLENLFFLQSDIADTKLKKSSIDFVVCDQVIMHTENPEKTFTHLSELTSEVGEFACYFYRKKALPRELVDDYFRTATHSISKEEMWQFSEQLTELGKRLNELNITFESPDIPLLGIKGGTYDIQRFIYWNFLKCYWNPEWGIELSKITNFDWYAPSNAKRFSKEEVQEIVRSNNMKVAYWHEEEACYSGRFNKLN
ncbi:MAG: class I SAM-dependent methyltransferase [Saprospiraceae bacterium]|nr:class I SAM-dependent methyltransferase [Saprospiraceae bacterium]